MFFAIKVALKLILLGFAAIFHAIFPFVLKTYVSSNIKKLHDDIFVNRFKKLMKQCKNVLKCMICPNPSKYGFFGDQSYKCGTFNSDFNKNSIISFIIFIVIIAVLYLIGIL